MEDSGMFVNIWKGDWGIPSIDTECLKILAYAKFAGAPINIKYSNNPFWSPKGKLPVFRHANITLLGFEPVCSYLRKNNYSTDHGLNAKECGEIMAYSHLIEEKLKPALKYLWWVDAKTRVEFTRPWFGKTLPFPFGLWYPDKYEKEAVDLIETMYCSDVTGLDVGGNSVETDVYRNARECLNLISSKLGQKRYMLGNCPSSLDAIVYATLAPLLKAPVPNQSLQNHLKGCNNLEKYVVRITQHYFPECDQKAATLTGTSNGSTSKGNVGREDSIYSRWKSQVLALTVAVGAMLAYAYSSGLLNIAINLDYKQPPTNDNDEDNDESSNSD